MAILAMCFDLMQEEIVAKFRWLGTKIGIVERVEQQNNDLTSKSSDPKSKTRSSINNGMTTQRTILEEDHDSPTQARVSSGTSGTRKTSPRTNLARVHPTGNNSNDEATLHQRTNSAKLY